MKFTTQIILQVLKLVSPAATTAAGFHLHPLRLQKGLMDPVKWNESELVNYQLFHILFISDLNRNNNSEKSIKLWSTKKKLKDPQEPTGLYQFVYRCISLILRNLSLILSHINSIVSKRDAESTLNHLQQSNINYHISFHCI